jgi:hypothetical protein
MGRFDSCAKNPAGEGVAISTRGFAGGEVKDGGVSGERRGPSTRRKNPQICRELFPLMSEIEHGATIESYNAR